MPSGCCEFSMILSKNGEYFLMHIFMRAIEHKDNPFTHLVNIPGSSKMETIAKLKLNRTGKTLIFSILQKTLSFIRRFLKSSELINFYFRVDIEDIIEFIVNDRTFSDSFSPSSVS
jgi:hypothetical protein